MSTTPIEWLGQTFDSHEELHFAYWLEEVKASGLIQSWHRDITGWSLTDGLYHEWTEIKQLKTKTKTEQKRQTLLQRSSYCPDFRIVWAPEAHGVLFQTLKDNCRITKPFIAHEGREDFLSDVEVKPEFDHKNMTRLFINNQKMVWQRWGVYVNLIKPTELFCETFTPERYKLTSTGKSRKIKWETQPITKYLAAHD